ncbi:hypothetical protein NDU88_007935 [Pleurodeles waltl]|uniref:Uncharacterized protein n=1 Tax=Pleurodeles waltl TaxID=8319 RepID=A0AAV7PUV7_PLEWA|nr:hypothetical protein NDU88_007935 [Pleurodeles waltl]
MLETMSQPLQNTLDKILAAISDAKTMLKGEIGTVAAELDLWKADHCKLVGRAEMVLSELQPAQKAMSAQMRALMQTGATDGITSMFMSMLDLPKSMEGSEMVVYLEL